MPKAIIFRDTLKITYDNDVITCITRDISGFMACRPERGELPDAVENRRFDISRSWRLKTVESFNGFIRRKSCT